MSKKIQVKESEPDVVDKIFEYLSEQIPKFNDLSEEEIENLKMDVREEFSGKHYVKTNRAKNREKIGGRVLAMFNGRNTHELARIFNISPSTVRRIIRQPGGVKPLF